VTWYHKRDTRVRTCRNPVLNARLAPLGQITTLASTQVKDHSTRRSKVGDNDAFDPVVEVAEVVDGALYTILNSRVGSSIVMRSNYILRS
jgi:hypothetical protein